jgi:hypothetical protein
MYAGITIMHYPPKRTDEVYKHIREVLVPHHQQLKSQGLNDALFLVNPESCQGIGIALWDNPSKLREVEQGNTREQARAMRDPGQAPTEYARLRAQWVEDLSGGIVSTDWYEVVGRVASSSSVLFPSVSSYRGEGGYAGITIMHYPPKRTEDVYKHIREVLVPHHEQLQSEGLKDALFLVNPESCQGIGIAIWDDPKKLREIEQGTSREMARAMRDPGQAPTEYTRLRAEWVEDLSGGIVSTDWYEVAGRVASSATGSASPAKPPYKGKKTSTGAASWP